MLRWLLVQEARVTCLLQLGGALFHLVLRASVGDDHHQLWDVPPHPVLQGEGLFVCVLERHSCSRGRRPGEATARLKSGFPQPTCLSVSSLVADERKRCHGNAFVLIRAEFELGLGAVAVLHERHLFGKNHSGS